MIEMAKLRQVMLFFLQSAPKHQMGITKLWKLLYYVDLMHLEQFGHTVTHGGYTKTRHGPLPEAGMKAVDQAVHQREMTVRRVRRFQHEQIVCERVAQPNLQHFEFSERAILAETTLHWMRATTAQLEAAIRHSDPWKTTKYEELIRLEP